MKQKKQLEADIKKQTLGNTKKDKRVWLITGSSSGFGHAITQEVLRHGGHVAATARTPEKIQDIEEEYPDHARAIRLDVTLPEEARAAVKTTREVFGRIDVVVNNAGYGLFGALEEFSEEELRQ